MCSNKEKKEIKDKKVLRRINKLEAMVKRKKEEKHKKMVKAKAKVRSRRGKQKRSLLWHMKKPQRRHTQQQF